MSSFSLSEDSVKKLRAFKRILDVVLDSESMPEDESKSAELVISIGLERMLQDVLPKEEMLIKTMTKMFDRNPEFVCQFVSDMIREGGEDEQRKQIEETRKNWRLYT